MDKIVKVLYSEVANSKKYLMMSIKVTPEKLSNISKHKTRKKISNSTFANKELIAKAFHLNSSIKVANIEFKKLNIPYLKDTKIVYYSPEKIILKSDREILKAKIKELQSQFLDILNTRKLFSKLKKIEVIIEYTKEKTTKLIPNNIEAKKALKKIKTDICNLN